MSFVVFFFLSSIGGIPVAPKSSKFSLTVKFTGKLEKIIDLIINHQLRVE